MTIADQKTPARPVEITFAPELGLPSANQELLLIGHAASGATGTYTVITISNVSDDALAKTEAETKFGAGSELSKMVVAAVKANSGGATFPAIKCVPLLSTDVGFGTSDQALTAAKSVKAEFIISPYSGADATLRGKIKDAAETMSGATRVDNNQFGTFAVVFDRSVSDASTLATPDTQYLIALWMYDSGSPSYSVGESAAACAAVLAANGTPFLPVNGKKIGSLAAPASMADWLQVGGGLASEVALGKGWTPLYVKPNGDVAFVRSVTTRITTNGVTVAGAYYDVQDFQVLYYWRKTVWTRESQDDFRIAKASSQTAVQLKSELIRLATEFEEQNMFQAVKEHAPLFSVVRSSSDRHRFDVVTPVNVIPGLHVIANTVRAGTLFDTISV